MLAALVVAAFGAHDALAATFTVTTTADSGAGSLRQAILDANDAPGIDEIQFDIGTGEQVIEPGSALPVVTDAVVIDGTTQPGFTGSPLVRIDGGDGTPPLYGLELDVASVTSSTVMGLSFTRWNTGGGAGLYVHGTGTAAVSGNFFGTDAGGAAGLGNDTGLLVANASQVGGTTPAERNVASGNITGIAVTGSASILGNYVGTTPAGTASLPNDLRGLLVQAAGAVVGGSAAGEGNVVSGNSGYGIEIAVGSTGTVVRGNRIGTSPFGDDLGNGLAGVGVFGGSGNAIGGTASVNDGNVIAYNAIGVVVGSGTGNAIRANDVYENDTLGIDLGPSGGDLVTPNDPAPDDDTGPNDLQNFPVLTEATVGGGLMVLSGTITSAPATAYAIDVFTTPTCDASGYGEGAFYNGRFTVITDDGGTVSFTRGFGFGGAVGQAVTATATDPAGNTSEFSACITSTAPALVVNSTVDPGDGDCTAAECTLREAIAAANASPNGPTPDEIHFDLDGSGVHAIVPTSELPFITDPVVIDGTTQPGYTGTPLVFLDGSETACGECGSGLVIEVGGSGSTIRGLAIGNFDGYGVRLLGSNANVLEASWVGVGPGETYAGNGSGGVRVVGADNRIGGPLASQRVVTGANATLSGGSAEIVITGEVSTGNLVQGSYIGLAPDGENSFDTENGVLVTGLASGNTIGGDSGSGEGNVLYGFYGAGVIVEGAGAGNVVAGNTIGRNTIGATGEAPGLGISVDDSPGTVIGANVGPADLASVDYDLGNVVHAAYGFSPGIAVEVAGASQGTIVAGNFLGTDRTGTVPFDTTTGVRVSSSDVQLGPGNTIAHNGDNGVLVDGASGNRIVANSIYDNGNSGITLLNGANNDLPAPTLDSAVSGSVVTTFTGTVTGPPGTYYVELFSNTACDGPAGGEGATYLGFATVAVTEPTVFAESLPLLPAGTVVTATATHSTTNDTSAFSGCVTVTQAVGPTVDVGALDAAPADTLPGLPQVAIADVPVSVLLAPAQGTASTPLGDTPLGDTPLGDTPLGDTPLGDTPLGDTGVSDPAIVPLLGVFQLSSLPLLRPGGWEALLAGTALAGRPLQNVTLRDVYQLSPAPAGLGTITLADLDLSRSRLGDVVALAFALGHGALLTEFPAIDWCAVLKPLGIPCGAGQSVLSVGLQGAPLGDTPLGDTPLGDTPLGDTPLGDTSLADAPLGDTPLGETPLEGTPLGDTPLADTPLGDTPLGDTQLAGTPLGDTPLADTDLRNAPLGEAPLGDTPLGDTPVGNTPLGDTPLGDVTNCAAIFTGCPYPPTDTIDQHLAQLRPGVTIADLVDVLTPAAQQRLTLAGLVASLANPNTFTLAHLLAVLLTPGDHTMSDVVDALGPAAAERLTLSDLVASLPDPNAFTLGDLLVVVLRASALWSRLDLSQPELLRVATGGGRVALRGPVTFAGTNVTTATVALTLPPGWAPVEPEPDGPLPAPWGATIEQITFPIGLTTYLELVSRTRQPDGSVRYEWRPPFEVAGLFTFRFDVIPGITLGPWSLALVGATPDTDPVAGGPALVNVGDTFEPNDDPEAAPTLAAGSLYVTYLTGAEDVDYFRFPVPPAGTRTTFRLNHLARDYDLVVYGPPDDPLRPDDPDAVSLETPVVGDAGAPITNTIDALATETLDDLALLTTRPVVGVSAFRSTEDENVVVVSDGTPGEYVVQVRGYNGASGPEPAMLQVETAAVANAPACTPRFAGLDLGTAASVDLSALPAGLDTVFLVNGRQLEASYPSVGQSVLDWFSFAHLSELSGLGHVSALVRVEDDPAVRTAYTAWNADPCTPSRGNDVARAVAGVLDAVRAARPTVRNVVLLGGDTVVPTFRLNDLTTLSNEADYASTFATGDDLYATLAGHLLPSDDPFGTTSPVIYTRRQLYVPQLAVGRLLEAPVQITAALDRFLTYEGTLDPATALTTGYDFLTDGAEGVHAALAAIPGVTASQLISDTWTSAGLAGALGTGKDVFAKNGHADHYRLQPADTSSGLYTPANLPASLERGVVLSMGCHAGLSVSDVSVAGAIAADWAQAYAGKGTTAFVANTGYGYGDTITTAYSEALNIRLAEGLRDGLSVGEALVRAKQDYFADLGVVGVYDEKAIAELSLYGLPMWRLAGPVAAAAPVPQGSAPAVAEAEVAAAAADAAALPAGLTSLGTVTDPVTGLQVERYRAEPVLTSHTVSGPSGGRYWSGPSGVQVTHLRPLQPKLSWELERSDAHGILVTGLASRDEHPVDPVFARPVVDASANEPELPFADVAFPAKIQSLTGVRAIDRLRQRAVLVHGQFFGDGVVDPVGAGVQRLFERVDLEVLRSAGTDRQAPRLQRMDAVLVGGSGQVAAFTVDTVDLPSGDAAGVRRVLVAFREEGSSAWRFFDLTRTDGRTWGGAAAVAATTTRIEYFVQAVDAAGNVGVSTNKGRLFAGTPPPPPVGGGVDAEVDPAVGGTETNGWYVPAAFVTVTADAGVAVSVSVDGAPFEPYRGPLEIAEDGLHTVRVRGSNGFAETVAVPVDAAPPTVELDVPGATVALGGALGLAFRCGDTASGVASCTATVDGTPRSLGAPVPSSPLGSTHTVVVAATDRVGHVTSQAFTYTVRARGILYTSSATGAGDIYLLPVDAGPSTVPTRMTATSFTEADPVWSPQADRIAFSSDRDGTWRVYVMDADGTDVTVVPTGSGDATAPTWSPDASRIAFVSTRSGNPDIWVVGLDGSNLRRLTTDSKIDSAPAWAPGTIGRIAWSNGPGGQLDLWTMRPDGTGKTRLTTTEDVVTEPAWKSDGTIAVQRRAKGTLRFEIWTVSANGKTQTRIVSSVRNDTQPTWLQDGHLVFATDRDDSRDYDLFRATKGKTSWLLVRITDAPGDDRAPNG